MRKNKLLLTFLMPVLFSFIAKATEDIEFNPHPPEPPAPPGITMVDSITIACAESNPTVKCEIYLIYDIRDDIVYIVKRGDRASETSFGKSALDRAQVASLAFQTIDLVSQFPDKTTAVSSYASSFQMVEGVLKIRVLVQFEGDAARSEKSINVNLPNN